MEQALILSVLLKMDIHDGPSWRGLKQKINLIDCTTTCTITVKGLTTDALLIGGTKSGERGGR
jgi:hypothetical protein